MTDQALREIIGSHIRAEREHRNMSIDDLAYLLGLTPGFIGLVERGQRGTTAHMLVKLSDAFGLPIDDLIYGGSAEAKEARGQALRSRQEAIQSLTYDLSEGELSFVIRSLKDLLRLGRHAKTEVIESGEA